MTEKKLGCLSALLRNDIRKGSNWPLSPWQRKGDESRLISLAKAPVRAFLAVTQGTRSRIRAVALLRRWQRRDALSPLRLDESDAASSGNYGLNRCDVFYINLKHRRDRREHFQREMQAIQVSNYHRIEAVQANPGSLGCAMSHVKVLGAWHASGGRMLLVCEDDAMFSESRESINSVVEEFYNDASLSVLCLGNNPSHVIPVSKQMGISADVQTTSCYVIKAQAVSPVLASAQLSVKLLKRGVPSRNAAIDKVWKSVQKELFFAVPLRRLVRQIAGQSDIDGRYRDYGV